jgi:hypothetical protein|tara:strand:- start:1421 stop:1837 length:417 start_codon:yes stop_codon:yes gene_type:complete
MNLDALGAIHLYGDPFWRGKCPTEAVEQSSFFNRLRREYSDTYGRIGLHIRNEGKRTGRQMQSIRSQGGFVAGAADIVIPGSPTFVCELKRCDHTQSTWQDGQIEYLESSTAAGAFVCVALGAAAAWDAFEDWLSSQK